MPERITFRGRGRGCAVEVGDAVSIVEPRVKFLRGQITSGAPSEGFVACGDGTAYPMEVTAEQLAEIMYRVRDAQFTTGEVDILFSSDEPPEDPPEDNHNISTFTFGTPPTNLYESDVFADFLVRGYCTSVASTDPTTDPDPMADYGALYFGDHYELTDGFGEYIKVREAVTEYALWAGVEEPIGTINNGKFEQYSENSWGSYFLPEPADMRFRTGFSYLGQDSLYSLLVGYPSGISDFDFAGGSTAYLNFSGEVAWVDVDASGDPFSSGNRLFIGMVFAQGNDPVILCTNTSEDLGTFSSSYATAPLDIDFEMELADGVVVSCPLYWGLVYDPGVDSSVYSATNYRIKATKWWPYADKEGDPAWDEDTGLPINGGPAT